MQSSGKRLGESERIVSSEDQILFHFQRVLEENNPIEIMTYYQGLPVSSKARLERVDSGSVVISVDPPASVCLCWEELGWILMDEFLGPIQAEVKSFDILSGLAVFEKFELMGPAFGRRAFLRVEAEEASRVDLESPEGSIQAWLKDVSLVGASLSVPLEEKQLEFKKFDRIRFTLHLPRGSIRLSGQVKNVVHQGHEQRIGLMYTDSIPLRGLIPDYISFRRAEILKEIADRYQAAYDGAKDKKCSG